MKTYFIERKVEVIDVYEVCAENYNEAKSIISEDRHNGKRIYNDGIVTLKDVSKLYKNKTLEPRKRISLDGKTWWCVFDTSTMKWSPLTCFGKYKLKKDCQLAIDVYNRMTMKI